MSWMAFGFWMSTVGALARALTVVFLLPGGPRTDVAAAAVMFLLLVANTVLAVRRLPPTDSLTARNAVWGVGMCGMLLAGLMVSIR
jgi:hypothetical protein